MPSLHSWIHVVSLSLSVSDVIAIPLNDYVSHEKRTLPGENPWRRNARVAGDSIIPLRIGLVQSNLDLGHSHLEAISHPGSPRYGQHLSADEVHSLFSPAEDTVDMVRDWLLGSGIAREDIVHSDNKGWLVMDLPASSVEQLFKTSIHEYEHRKTGALRLGSEEYHLPAHLTEHVDYITPGVKLSALVRKRSYGGRFKARDSVSSILHSRNADAIPSNLRNCSNQITPECIRALYSLPAHPGYDQFNAPGFYEQGDYYAQSDLDGFFTNFAPQIANGTEPIQQLIDGAIGSRPATSKQVGGEADGDLEVAFGLVYPTIPIVYQVDDPYYARHELQTYNLFNTFLDALDGSYCNYTAYGITGDSWRDPEYPDPHKNGYKGQRQCGVFKPATVISISYGEAESDIPIRYDKRQCNEWMKLSLQGHTILTASGDYGVAGFPGDGTANGCLPGPNQPSKTKHARVFNPDYLSSCPYVTSVGGTMVPLNQSVLEGEQAALVYFPNDSIPYSSSGGFSNYFPRPSWQNAAVKTWLRNHDSGYKSYVANAKASNIGEGDGLFNRAGRAFPDVSANSARIGLVIGGEVHAGYGTSFASPIWAATVSLINQQRSAAGKSPVGFINPVLYAHPWAMNDITVGTNPGCGTKGFEAVEGWDPVTGLGTPNYEKLLEVFMGMP